MINVILRSMSINKPLLMFLNISEDSFKGEFSESNGNKLLFFFLVRLLISISKVSPTILNSLQLCWNLGLSKSLLKFANCWVKC